MGRQKSLDLAVATGAKFVREIFTGVYASDFGLWNTNVGETIRHQHRIGADNVKLLFNIVPEAAKYVADREIESIVKSTVFNNRPDALCVSGLTAGAETDDQTCSALRKRRTVRSCWPTRHPLGQRGTPAVRGRRRRSRNDVQIRRRIREPCRHRARESADEQSEGVPQRRDRRLIGIYLSYGNVKQPRPES